MNNLFLEDGKIIRRKINNLSDLRKLSIFLSYFLKPEFFLILQGNLGVGKTTLVKMIASKMGITKRITSPTFNICNTYKIIRKNKIFYLNHFDFFRIKKEENLNDLFQDISIGNINIIEWGENNPNFWLTKKNIIVKIYKEEKSDIRTIVIKFSFNFSLKKLERFFLL